MASDQLVVGGIITETKPDPRTVRSHSMFERWEPPANPTPEPEPPPKPPLGTTELRHQLRAAIDRHKDMSDRVTTLEAAQAKAQAACRTAQTAVDEAEALLIEAKEDEPRSYVARLLANGDATDETDVVEAAERRLAEAQRKLSLARHGEEVIAEEIRKAASALSLLTMHRDSAIKDLVRSHRAVEGLRERYAKALTKAAELRQALDAVARHLPPHSVDNDANMLGDGVAFHSQRRIKTDGVIRDQWREALKRLETNAFAILPGEGSSAPEKPRPTL